uniref:DNA maturase B n=1 Tax=uncultured marine virus TaxID=186617 RepID=A0A0F7L8M9_9VIRU|nr:DNA maturase B [uncultured marine virus]
MWVTTCLTLEVSLLWTHRAVVKTRPLGLSSRCLTATFMLPMPVVCKEATTKRFSRFLR